MSAEQLQIKRVKKTEFNFFQGITSKNQEIYDSTVDAISASEDVLIFIFLN